MHALNAKPYYRKIVRFCLIHRKKNGEEYWLFPGGGVEDTETVEEEK